MIGSKVTMILTKFSCPWLIGHVKCDMWHVKCDMWLVTFDGWLFFSIKKKCQKKVTKTAKNTDNWLKGAQKSRKVSKRWDFIVLVLLSAHARRVCVSRYTGFSMNRPKVTVLVRISKILLQTGLSIHPQTCGNSPWPSIEEKLIDQRSEIRYQSTSRIIW